MRRSNETSRRRPRRRIVMASKGTKKFKKQG